MYYQNQIGLCVLESPKRSYLEKSLGQRLGKKLLERGKIGNLLFASCKSSYLVLYVNGQNPLYLN